MTNRLLFRAVCRSVAPTVLMAFVFLGPHVMPSAADDEPGGGQTVVLRGTVTLPDGSPADGGVISFGLRAQFGPVRNGEFEFSVGEVPPGDYVICYSRYQGGFLVVRAVTITPGQREAVVSLAAGEQPVVDGIVSTADLPGGVPNATVRVQGESPRFDWQLNTESNGRFLLDGFDLRGGTMQASVPYHRDSEAVEIEPPFPMQADLRAPDGTAIVGQAVDLTRRVPVADAVVAFGTRGRYGSTTTDHQGFFEFTGLEAGAYRLEARARFYTQAEAILELREGRPALGLVMPLLPQARAQVFGWVRGPGGPLAGATVSFGHRVHPPLPPGQTSGGSSGPGVPQIVYSTVSGEDGQYTLELPAPFEPGRHDGPWWIEVDADGHLTGHYTGSIEDPGNWGPYVFRLYRGGRLSGRVSLPGGIPAGEHLFAGVRIPWSTLGQEERPASASYGPEVPVDAETGRFDFGLIQPGVHQLYVQGRPEFTTTVTVREGEVTDVTVEPVASSAGPGVLAEPR